MTLAQIRTRVKTHIRAEMSTPAVNDIDDASIDEFANEHTGDVVNLLDPTHYPDLVIIDSSLIFAVGEYALPADYEKGIAVKVNTVSPAITKKSCRLFFDPSAYAKMDSSNFVNTPSQKQPVSLIAEGKVYIKPSALNSAAGHLDYIKKHPTITVSQDTLFSDSGDNMLVRFILADYYNFLEMPDLAAIQLNLIGDKK